ncbi:hypothetical protein CEXT_21301 [Caerostris extrusa]|uniref:Uncharacterized protein n=1 Tax=Caerostris extrusa TaxID=172846 RepID=A0AAV4QGA7_CAEEX|nr:hypothetical protein CEXT_21301 [Caerostris extrusa]
MDSTNQSVSHPVQLSAQRYNHQLQPGMWNNSKVCQNANGQSANMDPYSQQANHYYQAQYQSQSNDINRYVSPVSKDQNSNSVAYSQYPMQRQTSYSCPVPTQNYQVAAKTSCSSNMYYPNVNASKNYPPTNIHSPKSMQLQALGFLKPIQLYLRVLSILEILGLQCHKCLTTENTIIILCKTCIFNSNSPETSSLIGDGLSVLDNASVDAAADSMKMDISNSFVLPGSVLSHIPNNMQSSTITNSTVMPNRNSVNSLQPPANLDEGSQASSASASSSIPDEQNSMKNKF